MTMKFDFTSVFGRFGVAFTVQRELPGHYDYTQGGKRVLGGYSDPESMNGIVVPMSFEDLQFEAGGTYTRDDRKIYVKLPNALQINDLVTYRGITYRVIEEKDRTDYADFAIYIAKRERRGPGGA